MRRLFRGQEAKLMIGYPRDYALDVIKNIARDLSAPQYAY